MTIQSFLSYPGKTGYFSGEIKFWPYPKISTPTVGGKVREGHTDQFETLKNASEETGDIRLTKTISVPRNCVVTWLEKVTEEEYASGKFK